MEILVPTVNQVAKHLDDYIQAEELKLERLRWLVFLIIRKRNLSPIAFVCFRFRQSYENQCLHNSINIELIHDSDSILNSIFSSELIEFELIQNSKMNWK